MSNTDFCGTCLFCERDPKNLQQGICKHDPPQMIVTGPGQLTGFQPLVNPTQTWCSHHPDRQTTRLEVVHG